MLFYCKKKYTKIKKTPLYKAKTFEFLKVLSSFNSFNCANKVENTQGFLDKKPIFLAFKCDKVISLHKKKHKLLNYLDQLTSDILSSKRNNSTPQPMQLFSAMKDKMINALLKFTMFLLTCYKKKLSSFIYFFVIWNSGSDYFSNYFLLENASK
jgi:hypothetical protein